MSNKKQEKVLVQWEQQKSTILEYMKLSAQRLYKVKSGATLVNALDEQGSHVKEQFLKTRRKTETKRTTTESINASDDKIELTERLLQPEHVMDFMKQAQYDKNYGNPDRIKFDFYPELEEKIHQIAINEKPEKPPTDIMEILKQLKLNLPVRPRLKEQTFQEDGGKAVSDINRNLMTRIYGEEHEVAAERLDILQKEQKKQAIADLENLENSVVKIKKKKVPVYTPPIPPTGLIVKNHFKHNQSLETQELDQNIERARPKKDGVHTILKFRKGLASHHLFPDMKKITSSVDSFKMRAPENISHRDLAFHVKEIQPRRTEQKENKTHEIQRAKIKLFSGGTNGKPPIPIPTLNLHRRRGTDSSTILRPIDFSARLIQEEVDFLEKERSGYSHDKPLFRNSHNINNSNQYKETAHTARMRGSASKRDSLHSSQISLTISSLRTSGINNLKDATGGRKESKDFIKDVWSPPAEKQRGTSFDVTNQREYFHKIVSELEKIVDKNYPPDQNAPRKIKPPLLAKQGKSQSSHQIRRPSVGATKEVFIPNFGVSCREWKAG